MRYATGEGALDARDAEDSSVSSLFEFNISLTDLELLKNLKRRGPSKKFGDDSLQSSCYFKSNYVQLLQCNMLLTDTLIFILSSLTSFLPSARFFGSVRILRVCPWYEELEPVLRDRPMARRMGSKDSLAMRDLDIEAFTPNQATQDSQWPDGEDSDLVEGWIPTPPRYPDADVTDESDRWLDPNLKSTQPSPGPVASQFNETLTTHPSPAPVTGSIDDIIASGQHCRSDTPSVSQSGRKRIKSGGNNDNKKALVPFDSSDSQTARDGFGLKGFMSQMTTKEERAESQNQVIRAQERMTNQMTKAMTNIISSNRSMELAAKKEMAAEDLKYKTRLARANMVVDLIRAGQSSEDARAIAREELPDM